MKKTIILFFALILTACATQVTVTSEALNTSTPDTPTPTLAPTQQLLLEVPLEFTVMPPTIAPSVEQVMLTLNDAPPAYIDGIGQQAFPTGSEAIFPNQNLTIVKALRDHSMVPIMARDGSYGYEKDGRFYAPLLSAITDSESGQVLNLTSTVDENGLPLYQSEDGHIGRRGITEINCPEGKVCVAAISYNAEDAGVVFWVAVDPDSGEIERYLPMFYDARYGVNKHGNGDFSVDVYTLKFSRVRDKWNETKNGERALSQMEHVMGISYKAETAEGERVLMFVADNKVQQARDNEIFWETDFGGYVKNEDGIFVWDPQANAWVKAEKSIDSAVSVEPVLTASGRKFIDVGGDMQVVERIKLDEKNSLNVVTKKNTFVYVNDEWRVALLPEAQALVNLGMSYDSERNVAYDTTNGAVLGMVGVDGEWHSYENGMVQIPASGVVGDNWAPHPGGNVLFPECNILDVSLAKNIPPPLEIPIYNTMEDALWAIKDKLPWNDEPGVQRYREKQNKASIIESCIYWKYMYENATVELDFSSDFFRLSVTNDPSKRSLFSISDVQIPGGQVITLIPFRSIATDYYSEKIFVVGSAEEIFKAFTNGEIFIPGPREVRPEN